MLETDLIAGEDSIIVLPDILYGSDSLRRTKILIIDDEPRDVQFLERILRRVRIENFRSTMDSGSALSLFKNFQPDLVLIEKPFSRASLLTTVYRVLRQNDSATATTLGRSIGPLSKGKEAGSQ